MAVITAPAITAPMAASTSRRQPVLLGRGVLLAAVAMAAVLSSPVSYRASWSDWQFQSPVAELAIVPFIAFGIAAAVLMRFPYVRTVRLGSADVWVASVALGIAVLLQSWVLVQPGSYAWVLRFDSLTLPLATTAAFSLLFGVRSLVVLWPAVAYSLLAWPLPASAVVELLSGPVTTLTSTVVDAILAVMPAAPDGVRQGPDLVLQVSGLRGDFDVAVTSACSGLSGMLGTFVVGTGLLYLYDGRLRNRAAWLASGLALVLVLNVVRILGLVAAGVLLGPGFALGVLHPYVGLLVVNLVLVVMLMSAHRFGLRRRSLRPADTDNPLHEPGPRQPDRRRRLIVRTASLMCAVSLLGLLNIQMAYAAPVYRNSSLGTISSLSGLVAEASPLGYTTRSAVEQEWARKYFGADSRWTRFILESAAVDVPTVWVDVLDTNSMASLRTHSTMQCYRLHEQDVLSRRSVSLGNGVLVDVMVVEMVDGVWHVVTWERPIERGSRVGHERVTLLASSERGAFAREFSDIARPDSLRRRLVDGVNAMRPGADPNPSLSRSLLALADDMESAGTAAEWAGAS